MNDYIIFSFGVFVSLIVTGAVGLLIWGASQDRHARRDRRAQRERAPLPTSSRPRPSINSMRARQTRRFDKPWNHRSI